MAHHHRPAGPFVTFLATVSASLAISAGDVAARRTDPPGHDDGNHCVTLQDVDLNVLYGVSDQFRTRECQDVTAGEHWIVPLFWIVNFGADAVYPEGYVPARPEPIDDFVSKLVGIKFVIDGGPRPSAFWSSRRPRRSAPTSTPRSSNPACGASRSRWRRCCRGCGR